MDSKTKKSRAYLISASEWSQALGANCVGDQLSLVSAHSDRISWNDDCRPPTRTLASAQQCNSGCERSDHVVMVSTALDNTAQQLTNKAVAVHKVSMNEGALPKPGNEHTASRKSVKQASKKPKDRKLRLSSTEECIEFILQARN